MAEVSPELLREVKPYAAHKFLLFKPLFLHVSDPNVLKQLAACRSLFGILNDALAQKVSQAVREHIRVDGFLQSACVFHSLLGHRVLKTIDVRKVA